MLVKHYFANMCQCHILIYFALDGALPLFSQNTETVSKILHTSKKNNTPVERWQFLAKAEYTPSPVEEGIKFGLLRFASLPGKSTFCHLFFFFPPVFKPLQVQPESKVAEPACITLYQPAFDQSNQCRLPKGASDQQAQLLTAATIHTTAQCLPGKDKNAQSADKCSAAKSQVHHAFTRNME